MNFIDRFDQVDTRNKKSDPTLRKYKNPGETVIQMLLAAKEGDELFLKRYVNRFGNVEIYFPYQTLNLYPNMLPLIVM